MGRQKGDVEAGRALLRGSREDRWDFIRKVYMILFFQILATTVFAAFVDHFDSFFKNTWYGIAIYVVVLVLGHIVMVPLYYSRNRLSLKIFFLVMFTMCFAFTIGIASAFVSGKVVIETASVMTVVVVSLTIFTFWAASRGHQDFGFLYPFLLSAVVIVVIFSTSRIFYTKETVSEIILSAGCAILFCGCIIYDTGKLMKDRSDDDDCIWAAVRLYLAIISLFWTILKFLKDAASVR